MIKHICVLAILLFCFFKPQNVLGSFLVSYSSNYQIDTLEDDLSEEDIEKFKNIRKPKTSKDTIDVKLAKLKPFINIADFLKGEKSGAYVQQLSGESGSNQTVIIRGASKPLFDMTSLNEVRPTIYINGIPVVTKHNFAFNIKNSNELRIGPETDFLNFLDISSITSIEIVKDPVKLSNLGLLASNGAILITTLGGESGKQEISFNAYYGFNQKPAVTPVNAKYENLFRQQFYSLYNNSVDSKLFYPGYLADSTNLNYYGPSNWHEEYNRVSPIYSANFSIKGGSERANFGFIGAHTSNSNSSDQNKLDRYNALLNINMLPFSWFTVSTYLNANRTERDRNRSLRDRYLEMGYIPSLSTPLSPNVDLYRKYLKNYERAVDDNITNNLQGSITLSFDLLKDLKYTTSFAVDYSEGIRDAFYPKELMETVNYVSNYYGYSQRYIFSNNLSYNFSFNEKNHITINSGISYLDDLYRYSYSRAFDGPNDFIKINVVKGDPSKDGYLQPQGGLKLYRWYNTEYNRLFSAFGNIGYVYDKKVELNAVFRWDGSSTVQENNRWFLSPSASLKWNVDEHFGLSDPFSIKFSAGRLGRVEMDSRFAVGPQYGSNLNWSTETTLLSYYGNAILSRPYDRGWVGYDLDWAYTDQFDLTLEKFLLNNRISTSLSLYQKDSKNQIILIPVPEEYGYSGQFKNGLGIRNRGIDFDLSFKVLADESRLNWTTNLNLNYNTNKIISLPDNLNELVYGNKLLKVGKSADSYWLFENEGIYGSLSEIPVSNAGVRLNLEGINFNIGDPKWKDSNNDFVISDDDKVLKGNSLPKVFGGFNNSFSYKNFDLNISTYFSLGNKALNQRAANKYNFINAESNNTIDAVREIYHWQQDIDISKYPLYNVWSSIDPYRVEQDLFLEDASYFKIRSISLGYELTKASFFGMSDKLRRAYIYCTINNLITFTKFSGIDPELIRINGIYNGSFLPITPTYSLGFKLDL